MLVPVVAPEAVVESLPDAAEPAGVPDAVVPEGSVAADEAAEDDPAPEDAVVELPEESAGFCVEAELAELPEEVAPVVDEASGFPVACAGDDCWLGISNIAKMVVVVVPAWAVASVCETAGVSTDR